MSYTSVLSNLMYAHHELLLLLEYHVFLRSKSKFWDPGTLWSEAPDAQLKQGCSLGLERLGLVSVLKT